MRATAFAFLMLVTATLSACAYKPLKAPCAPDEAGTPLAYSDMPAPTQPEAFESLDRCGPMRPI